MSNCSNVETIVAGVIILALYGLVALMVWKG